MDRNVLTFKELIGALSGLLGDAKEDGHTASSSAKC